MECKSIWEEVFVAGIEVHTWDGRRVEGQVHVGQARANELTINSGVMGEGGAKEEISFIDLVSEVVLKLEPLDISANGPKFRIIVQS